MSRTTSKSASADRRATSRSAVFTVALSPRVPSADCAAASAPSSTSTVVRPIGIILSHLDVHARAQIVLPCRRAWVRVPSAACKSPANAGLFDRDGPRPTSESADFRLATLITAFKRSSAQPRYCLTRPPGRARRRVPLAPTSQRPEFGEQEVPDPAGAGARAFARDGNRRRGSRRSWPAASACRLGPGGPPVLSSCLATRSGRVTQSGGERDCGGDGQRQEQARL